MAHHLPHPKTSDIIQQRLRALERRAYRVSELPAEIVDAIEGAKMSAAHAQLNDLL